MTNDNIEQQRVRSPKDVKPGDMIAADCIFQPREPDVVFVKIPFLEINIEVKITRKRFEELFK